MRNALEKLFLGVKRLAQMLDLGLLLGELLLQGRQLVCLWVR
jgi:hypothetical protein